MKIDIKQNHFFFNVQPVKHFWKLTSTPTLVCDVIYERFIWCDQVVCIILVIHQEQAQQNFPHESLRILSVNVAC